MPKTHKSQGWESVPSHRKRRLLLMHFEATHQSAPVHEPRFDELGQKQEVARSINGRVSWGMVDEHREQITVDD